MYSDHRCPKTWCSLWRKKPFYWYLWETSETPPPTCRAIKKFKYIAEQRMKEKSSVGLEPGNPWNVDQQSTTWADTTTQCFQNLITAGVHKKMLLLAPDISLLRSKLPKIKFFLKQINLSFLRHNWCHLTLCLHLIEPYWATLKQWWNLVTLSSMVGREIEFKQREWSRFISSLSRSTLRWNKNNFFQEGEIGYKVAA